MGRCAGGADDEAHLLRRDPGHVQGLPTRLGSQRGRSFGLVGHDVARHNAGVLSNPFVGRVDNVGQVVVGNHLPGSHIAPAHHLGVRTVDRKRGQGIRPDLRDRRVRAVLAVGTVDHRH